MMRQSETIVTCQACSHRYIYPDTDECPSCGTLLAVRSLSHALRELHAAQPLEQVETERDVAPAHLPNEIDHTSRILTWIGVGLGAFLMLSGYFDSIWLQDLLFSLLQPSPTTYTLLRWFFVALGFVTVVKGLVSIANWSNGRYFYRRFWS